jgi:ribonuclease HII
LIKEYPELEERYGISTGKGYPVAVHREGLEEHGICQFHRTNFSYCKGKEMNPV